MSRMMFLATTLALLGSVGERAFADQFRQPVASDEIPPCVCEFLRQPNGDKQNPSKDLRALIDLNPLPISSIDLDVTVHRTPVGWTNEPDAAQLPYVPLPSPLWTGAAGLAGLGFIRLIHRLRRTLR